MKKILLLLVAMFGLCRFADAQYAESFIKKYKEVPEAQYQHTPFKDLAEQQAAEMDTDAKAEAEKAMKYVDLVETLGLELKSSKDVAKFRKDVKRFAKKGYEVLSENGQDGFRMRTFVKKQSGNIKELVLIVEVVEGEENEDEEDLFEEEDIEALVQIIRVTGDIKEKDLGDILKVKIDK